MSIQTQSIPATTPIVKTSPSKNRRRRRKNNKNKNKNKPQTNPKSKPKQIQTQIYSPKKSKNNPWQKTKTASKFDSIMNEQTAKQTNHTHYIDDEAELLEQQMILQAIAESQKLQKTDTNTDTIAKIIETDQKSDEEKRETLTTDYKQQTMSDEILAIHLQKEEQNKLLRLQKLSERHNGKYAKVISSTAAPTSIPKSALQFYFEESTDNTLEYSKELISDAQIASEETVTVFEEEMEAISKHDAKIWSETHINRLNEYETGGDMDMNMNMGNQCFNSFRNQLDKKGFITYHNYQLQASDKKR